MKILFFLILLAAFFSPSKCSRSNGEANCYKGRLEIKGICSNYTIALVEGDLDSSRISPVWTDESTGKTYRQVFALGSPCSFPPYIEEGQEFYFTIGEPDQNCAVCQAYYPTPPKSLAIKVLDKSCR